MTKFEKLLLLLLANYFRFKIDESVWMSESLKKKYGEYTDDFIKEINR